MIKGFKLSREYVFRPSTILGNAIRANVAFITYLFEELNLKPSAMLIKELCETYASDFKVVAYLLSILEQSPSKAKELRTIALNNSLSLEFLFTIVTTRLVTEGNPHSDHRSFKGFVDVVAGLIKEKEKELHISDVLHLVQKNPEALKGAMFYYCTARFAEQTQRFSYLLTYMMQQSPSSPIGDIQNSSGESLIVFAYKEGCISIVEKLLARKANPDLPDNNGETLLNRVIRSSMSNKKEMSLVQDYITDITHSLCHASKEGFFSEEQFKELLTLSKGQTHGITVKELLENTITKSFNGPGRTITILFTYLSIHNARILITLLKNPSFLEQYPNFKDKAPSYLATLEALDASIMPEPAKRLKLEPITNPQPTALSFFAVPEPTAPSKDPSKGLEMKQ